MKRSILVLALSLAVTAAVAQRADPTLSAKRQEAVEAARSPKLGEGDPVPKAAPKVPRDERHAARQARRPQGAEQARTHPVGEGNPMPASQAKVSREDRTQARAERKAESRRANKAGEITARGETGY